MATGETHNKLKQIKQSFHLFMNGITAQSMREKGAEYKVNWGIDLINLRKIAKEYGKDYDLAIALWKENSRECKILATYIMPAEKINADIGNIDCKNTHKKIVDIMEGGKEAFEKRKLIYTNWNEASKV